MPNQDGPHPGSIRPGQVVAEKYWIERVLGRGGMGTVALATHLQLGSQVALKFLRPSIASDEASYLRFLREARATAQLRGEHVIRVLDMGLTDQNVPFIVMEYLPGHDLEAVIAQGSLEIATAVDYVMQAATGVAEAHAAGIIHRDLKPSNIFLARGIDGRAQIKIMDFGLAKWLTETRSDLTLSHAILGSPGYMAPEQLRNARTVDTRADIWSLGAVLYELLTGRRPYDGSNLPQLVAQVLSEPHRPLPDTIPAPLRQVVDCCLAPDAGDRYPTVEALAVALAPFGSSAASEHVKRLRHVVAATSAGAAISPAAAPTLDVTVPTIDAHQAPARRLHAVVAALAAIALALLVAVVAKRSGQNRPDRHRQPALETADAGAEAPHATHPTIVEPSLQVVSESQPGASASASLPVSAPREAPSPKRHRVPARASSKATRTVAPGPTPSVPRREVPYDTDGDGIPDIR